MHTWTGVFDFCTKNIIPFVFFVKLTTSTSFILSQDIKNQSSFCAILMLESQYKSSRSCTDVNTAWLDGNYFKGKA